MLPSSSGLVTVLNEPEVRTRCFDLCFFSDEPSSIRPPPPGFSPWLLAATCALMDQVTSCHLPYSFLSGFTFHLFAYVYSAGLFKGHIALSRPHGSLAQMTSSSSLGKSACLAYTKPRVFIPSTA